MSALNGRACQRASRLALLLVFLSGLARSARANDWQLDVDAARGLTRLAEALVSALPQSGRPTNRFPNKKVLQAVPLDRAVLRSMRRFGIANVFQSDTSTQRGSGCGVLGHFKLSTVERGLLQLQHWENQPSALHARYAFMDPHGDFSDVISSSYGSAVFEYRNDRIANRTTYSISDSFNRYVDSHFRVASPGTPMTHDAGMAWASSSRGKKVDRYVEAQVWGPVSLRDIGAINVLPRQFKALQQELRAVAADFGVDVYVYTPEDAGIREAYKVGARELKIRGNRRASSTMFDSVPPGFSSEMSIAEHNLLADRLGLHTKRPPVSTALERQFSVECRNKLQHDCTFMQSERWLYQELLTYVNGVRSDANARLQSAQQAADAVEQLTVFARNCCPSGCARPARRCVRWRHRSSRRQGRLGISHHGGAVGR